MAKGLTLYGEMHRMMPSLASLQGYHSSEIEVEHHPRLHGKSKYGVKRFLRGFMDLLTVYFLKNFRERPLHLFGGSAAASFLFGCLLFGGAVAGLLPQSASHLGAAFMVVALPMLGLGFFSELMVSRRTEQDRELPISETVGSGQAGGVGACALDAGQGDAGDTKDPLVLIVDDDARTRGMYRSHLTHHGYRTVEASNGLEALTKLSPDVAVVLMDMRMPGGGGLAAMRELRRNFPHVKVVIISGEDELNNAVSVMKLGAFDYLAKPVTESQLTHTVVSALELSLFTERRLLCA